MHGIQRRIVLSFTKYVCWFRRGCSGVAALSKVPWYQWSLCIGHSVQYVRCWFPKTSLLWKKEKQFTWNLRLHLTKNSLLTSHTLFLTTICKKRVQSLHYIDLFTLVGVVFDWREAFRKKRLYAPFSAGKKDFWRSASLPFKTFSISSKAQS